MVAYQRRGIAPNRSGNHISGHNIDRRQRFSAGQPDGSTRHTGSSGPWHTGDCTYGLACGSDSGSHGDAGRDSGSHGDAGSDSGSHSDTGPSRGAHGSAGQRR